MTSAVCPTRRASEVTSADARLFRALRAATDAAPTARRTLVVPDINMGRELLATLARRTGGWIGWEVATLRSVADDLAFVPLSERGLRVAGDLELATLVDVALERATADGALDDRFAALRRGLGFRRCVRDALLELRMAGVTAEQLRQGTRAGTPSRELAAVLARYEEALAHARCTDVAGVFATALDMFDDEAPFVLDERIHIVPGLSARGLPGALADRLRARGATVLDGDAPRDTEAPDALIIAPSEANESATRLAWLAAIAAGQPLPSPDDPRVEQGTVAIDLFAAATPEDEMREVLRRAVAEGWRFDDVEIVTTDPDRYGVALAALCARLDVRASMVRGVPFARTRLGRALDRWLGWLQDGLPADVVRQALEGGELNGDDETPPGALARALRGLQVGWGRARWDAALVRLAQDATEPALTRYEDEDDASFEARRARRMRESASLHALLTRLLEHVPCVPERGEDVVVRCTPAAIARATIGWLGVARIHGMAEQRTVDRLRTRLGHLVDVAVRETTFASAMAVVRDALSDLRAWPEASEARLPWMADGGALHLTDVASAGATGRPRTFVVGLDAERAGGACRQDPLLPDAVRTKVAPGALATSHDRSSEHGWRTALALAGLRGHVTLSWSVQGAIAERETGPAPVVLDAWRLLQGDATLTYEQLRAHAHPLVTPVVDTSAAGDATDGRTHLDGRDVWLGALADGALLLDGSATVRAAWSGLDGGLRALETANDGVATPWHGLVPSAGDALDPREHGRPISPSSLEMLARCPLGWFYQQGLRLYAPQEPEYDVDHWLDALQRGSLLHAVYERAARDFAGRHDAFAGDEGREAVLGLIEQAIAEWKVLVPPPGQSVFAAESEALRQDALAFWKVEHDLVHGDDGARWEEVEAAFGMDGAPPGDFVLPDGTVIRLRGRIDRIDRYPDGALRIVDYKTGSSRSYRERPETPFHGGRHLQPALYAAAVEQRTGAPVAAFEYRFPTARGEGEIVRHERQELGSADGIVASLLDEVAAGRFLPTTDVQDCGFCACQPICRAGRSSGMYATTHSPRADWGDAHAPHLGEYATLRRLRAIEAAAPTTEHLA